MPIIYCLEWWDVVPNWNHTACFKSSKQVACELRRRECISPKLVRSSNNPVMNHQSFRSFHPKYLKGTFSIFSCWDLKSISVGLSSGCFCQMKQQGWQQKRWPVHYVGWWPVVTVFWASGRDPFNFYLCIMLCFAAVFPLAQCRPHWGTNIYRICYFMNPVNCFPWDWEC